MDLYFAKLGLVSGGDIGFPEFYDRAQNAFNWLRNRGLEATRNYVKTIRGYDLWDDSLVRYGVTPCNDIVVDLDVQRVGKSNRVRMILDLASNSQEMMGETFSGLRGRGKSRLEINQRPTAVKTDANADYFDELTSGNFHVMVYSTDQLRKFLGLK